MQGGRKQVGGRGVGNNGFSTIVFDTYDRDGRELKGAQEKADYLQSMIDVLEQNGQRASQLYDGLVKQRNVYLDYINNQQNAANDLVNAWITYSQSFNNELSQINIDSVESFEKYRQKMIEAAKSDDSIGQILADGTLSEESLEIAVNDFMSTATQFSEWYEQWLDNYEYQNTLNSVKSKFGDTFEIETDSLNEAKENLEYEFQKLSDWGLEDYSGFVQNGVQSVFGNVDMDKRTIITWSDELKQTYADALASWDYEPEIGGIDTVFGGSGRFGEDINGTGWEVAFTPILPDGTFLSSDTVYEYIESIVAEAYSQNGEVTENALKSIDAQGRQIGNTFVHGIFAAVDDSLDYDNNGNLAETVGRLMHFTGDFGAVKLAKQEIEDARKVIDWDSWVGENVKTPDEIELFQKIVQEANNAADAIEKYKSARNGIVIKDGSFNIDTYKDQIDDIQSSISTLRSALDSFNSGTLDTSAVIDLMQQFPALVPYVDLAADGFGNLSEGLSTLIAQQPDSLIQSLETLKDSLTTDEERAQVDALINSLQALSSYGDTGMEAYATSIGSTWTDTANVIESVTTQFENLAKVQEAVADGLTMSTTAAAELAKMYPEILTNAEYAGNGQITLNEEVVKSILAGDQAIINAQITKLEADKAELEARKETAIAELEIANQVGTAKGQIDEETARNKIALLNQELENEISKNNQVGQSYAKTAEGMALNTEQLGNYEADVADNMATNMNTASSSMADGMATNSEASQISLSGIAQKATDVALAIAGIPTGNTIKNPSAIYAGRGGTNKGGIKKVASPSRFTSTVNDFVKGELSLNEFKSNIEVDISSYEKAISNIDSQIDVLKNLQTTFNDTVNSVNGGIGGHNYANKIKDLEKEKDKINNALKDKKDSSKKEKDEYKEVFDFFEHRIKVLDNALSILKANLDNVTGSFAKNNLIDAELDVTEEKFKNYSDALNMYTQKANDALSKLPADIAAKVKDGAVDLTTFIGDGNKEVVEAIKDYEQWADKVSDCKQELAELRTAIRQLELEKFNNIMEDFTSQFDLHEDGKELISKQVDLLKEAGQLIGESFFTTQIDQSKKQLALLEDEKVQLVNQMSSAIGSGRVD